MDVKEIEQALKNLRSVHYLSGPVHQSLERLKAAVYQPHNELETIYHLVESHSPSLRYKTELRYHKILAARSDNIQNRIWKNHDILTCKKCETCTNVQRMLEKVTKMPSEWTLVQLTPFCNPDENMEIDINMSYTNSLFVSVFNCGENQFKPFCVKVPAPQDTLSGSSIEMSCEMKSIIRDNKATLISSKEQKHFRNLAEKENYYSKRQCVDDRLKALVKDLQGLYLREWRCLMMGKYINTSTEIKIMQRIKKFFKTDASNHFVDDRTLHILRYIIKSANYLKLEETKRAVKYLFPDKADKELQRDLVRFVRKLHEDLSLSQEKRHPVILILDDRLDCFPWEMMDVLNDTSVSRVPSLFVAYTLFEEHCATIKNGFKIVNDPYNGSFVLNPDLDLGLMQNRISSFFEYWTPQWKGVIGTRPTEDEFEKMLTSAEIFSYNGHGNGCHLFSSQKVERIRTSAVVLLFGCGSVRVTQEGPQTEMIGAYQMYLIACSPCIIGMLWEVTDLDTDILTTELLSQWIPNQDKVHWKLLDKTKWKRGTKVNFSSEKCESRATNSHEPELLEALCKAKKSNLLNFYSNRAACVARGIPVKISM